MKGWVAALSLISCLVLLIFWMIYVLRFTNAKSEINVLKIHDEMLNMEYQDIKERNEITNTICKKPDIKNNTIFMTQNKNNNHGYGLKNVKQAVERYNGLKNCISGQMLVLAFFIY